MIHYFSEYLSRAASALNLSREDLLQKLREQYDGFSFDRQAKTHVYCPWSVLNFLTKPAEGFQNYWYTSGGQPAVLLKYLTQHPLSQPITYSEQREIRLSELGAAGQYDEMGLDVLLTQAGYYTIRQVTDDQYAVLGYPNHEVSMSMAQLYADELLKGRRIRPTGGSSIYKIMCEADLDEVINQLNTVVSAIDYQRYPITDEASCRAYLQVLLIGAAMIPRVEIHNALGRSDMEVEAGHRHWVFEFKYAKQETQVPTLLEEAVKQMKERRYGTNHSNQKLLRVTLVFSEKSRQFVAWEEVFD